MRWILCVALMSAACGSDKSNPVPPPNHLACGSGLTITAGNTCCSDGQQRPDCTLSVIHTGYWELQCPAPLGVTCGGMRTESFDVTAAGQLIAIYTTGSFHIMTGEVKVWLDGVAVGKFEALLPAGTVNSPLTLGPVTSGSHHVVMQYSSTDGGIPASWGGFLDVYVKI